MSFPVIVALETEIANDSRTMFRLRINGNVVGENLTAAQAHLLVGDVLERIVLPNKARRAPPSQAQVALAPAYAMAAGRACG
jgi:hypothetical protein